MNKRTEDKILEMLLHVHEKSTGAHPGVPSGFPQLLPRPCTHNSLRLTDLSASMPLHCHVMHVGA